MGAAENARSLDGEQVEDLAAQIEDIQLTGLILSEGGDVQARFQHRLRLPDAIFIPLHGVDAPTAEIGVKINAL